MTGILNEFLEASNMGRCAPGSNPILERFEAQRATHRAIPSSEGFLVRTGARIAAYLTMKLCTAVLAAGTHCPPADGTSYTALQQGPRTGAAHRYVATVSLCALDSGSSDASFTRMCVVLCRYCTTFFLLSPTPTFWQQLCFRSLSVVWESRLAPL